MKPVDLIINALDDASVKNDLVLDIFLGSGSTLIACEKMNRICYGMELDPHYCDVIIKRWEDYTGNRAELINGSL
jgi:DNA modification methylase